MGSAVLDICSVRTDRPVARLRARLSDRALMVAKAVLSLVGAGMLCISQAMPGRQEVVTGDLRGIGLSYPADWHGKRWSLYGLEACELRADVERDESRMPPGPTQGCRVSLERLTWREASATCLYAASPEDGPREYPAPVLGPVAAYLGMHVDAADAHVERVSLGGRSALMMVAPRYDGWGAVVVAPAEDLVILHLFAPTADARRRVWSRWMAMVRGALLRGPG